MNPSPSCHCGDIATLCDPLTGIWECFACKYGAKDDCDCRLFVSPHTKAIWVRQKMEQEYQQSKRRYTEEEVQAARREAWQEGWLSAQIDYDLNPYGRAP